jgi:hypothetical protein
MNQIYPAHSTTIAFSGVQAVGFSLATKGGIEEWIKQLAEEANHGCGLVYELFVKRLSGLIDSKINEIAPEHQAMAMEIAQQYGYASPNDLEQQKNEIEESGLCSLTGIDPWCCPCGRHE